MISVSKALVGIIGSMNIHRTGLRVVEGREGLFDLFATRRFKGACEIGVQDGNFSEIILRRLACDKLFLVDPWMLQDAAVYAEGREPQHEHDAKHDKVKARFQDSIAAGRVFVWRAYSAGALPMLKGRVDWVYVDGNHAHPFVRDDLRLCAESLIDDSFICGHDLYDNPSYGVVRAVGEFCRDTQWRLWGCTNDQYPSYVLRKDGQE